MVLVGFTYSRRVRPVLGGQQQRVAVERALAMQPALILADEPTGNLDTKSADGVFGLLQSVCKEQTATALFVTHNPLLSAMFEIND